MYIELFINLHVVEPMKAENIEDTPKNRLLYATKQYRKAKIQGSHEEVIDWHACVNVLKNDLKLSTD